MRIRTALWLCLLLAMVAVLGCGSAAQPNAGAYRSPLAQAGGTEDPAPEPTTEPTTEPESEPDEPTEEPEPEPTAEPTKEPWPTDDEHEAERERVRSSGEPRPILIPFPMHPEGLDGCKGLTLFTTSESLTYGFSCSELLNSHVKDTCGPLPTAAEQWECGKGVVLRYDSFDSRYGLAQCWGIPGPGPVAEECSRQAMENFNKAFTNLFDSWAKVRIGGDRDAEVVKAWDATIACLEDMGFKDVNRDILFPWQDFSPPDDHVAKEDALTGPDKDLRERLREASRDCAKREGLFAAQDAAWATELRRLSKDEPDLVAHIIREGMLEELEKPGVTALLSGDPLDDAN